MLKKGSVLQSKSPAAFFAENKNIAGFDNPGKSLYTTIRELVENALDSAESIANLPNLEITVEEVSKSRLNKIRGLDEHDRIDGSLYVDFESVDKKKKREEKEAKEQKGEGSHEVTVMKKDLVAQKKGIAVRGNLFYKVTVKDNGSGMPHKDIPNMLGRVLSGTKYGVKQTRGKFGLGAKMALIWSKMTTGLPFEIYSARKGHKKSHYILDIDIFKNEPNVRLEEQLSNDDDWHGAQLSITIEGNWSTYKNKIIKYLRQIAVITPRRTDVMPAAPRETKHHPSSVDLELVKQLLKVSPAANMVAFLRKEFDCITAAHAVRFNDPNGNHLSPAGEYNLRLGVMKELKPDMIATYQGDTRVFEGHAFIVEAAISMGGKDVRNGLNIYRFANRIPLLFEGGSDVITRTAMKRIMWNNYKMNIGTDKIGVFVSIVSTKIPFKGAGKEYIGDDVEEMVGAVKQAIQSCCIQLKAKIMRANSAKEQKQRKRNLQKYIPNCCNAIFDVLLEISANPERWGPKRRKMQEAYDVIAKVEEKQVNSQTLQNKLLEHIEKIDTDLAMEYQMQQGLTGNGAKDDLFIVPLIPSKHAHGPELHSNVAVVKLLDGY
eukprot:gene22158-29222_t